MKHSNGSIDIASTEAVTLLEKARKLLQQACHHFDCRRIPLYLQLIASSGDDYAENAFNAFQILILGTK